MEAQEIRLIDLDRISTENTQTRAGLRESAVEDYSALIQSGVDMEPAVVFDDGAALHLAAGFHRRTAYQRASRKQMPCWVRSGTRWDAIKFGIEDNLQHRGERLTLADRRHNARLVLKEQPGLSDRAIAELCRVSPTTVGTYRGDATVQTGQSSDRVGRDGRVYDTSNLARKPAPAPEAPKPDSTVAPAQEARMPDSTVEPAPEAIPEEKASKEVVEQWFAEATERLGKLEWLLDRLGNARPGPFYQKVMDNLDKAGLWLQDWKKWEPEL